MGQSGGAGKAGREKAVTRMRMGFKRREKGAVDGKREGSRAVSAGFSMKKAHAGREVKGER